MLGNMMTIEFYPDVGHLGLVANNDDLFVKIVAETMPATGVPVDDQSLCPAVPDPPTPEEDTPDEDTPDEDQDEKDCIIEDHSRSSHSKKSSRSSSRSHSHGKKSSRSSSRSTEKILEPCKLTPEQEEAARKARDEAIKRI